MPLICNLCGFVAAERSTTGSMKLHALRKHGEPDYLKLFEGNAEPKAKNTAGSTTNAPKKKAEKPEVIKRLLNPRDPDEARAIDSGYRFIVENGPDSDNWDLVK